jgi:hypothetical protein
LRVGITVIFLKTTRPGENHLNLLFSIKKILLFESESYSSTARNEINLMKIIKVINLTAAFFLEIAMITAFGYFGFHYPQNILLKYLLMIALPVIAIVLWGYFAAPKSNHRLQQPYRMVFASGIFSVAVFTLNITGKTMLAAVFAIMVILNQLLLFIFKQ